MKIPLRARMSRNPGPWLLGVRNPHTVCSGTGEVLAGHKVLDWSVCFCPWGSMTHFTKRVRWWWAGLGFGAWSGKVRGGCHGSFWPEGAGRSALRAARVASGSFVQNPLPGTQNVGLQGMPRIWTGCGTALESVMSGVGWALFGPRFEDRTSSLEKPSFGWAILGPHAGALGGWAGAGICGWYR